MLLNFAVEYDQESEVVTYELYETNKRFTNIVKIYFLVF